jgi:hypothetical protein
MYKRKFLQNDLGEHYSKGSKVGFEDFEDTTPKGFSEKEISGSSNQNAINTTSHNLELVLPPTSSIPQTYFGMSLLPFTKPHRLKLFWFILEECIEERKEFIFLCENVEEADELKILTYTFVFQLNDIWEVLLDDLVVKATPPRTNSVPNGN